MTEQEIDAIANKIADILERRFNERQDEITKKAIDLLWNTPFPQEVISGS